MARFIATALVALSGFAAIPALAWQVPASHARFAAQDSAGNLVVANISTVAKLDAVSGAEIWRYDGDPTGSFALLHLAGNDDVFVAGRYGDHNHPTLVLTRLSGATGQPLWNLNMPGDLFATTDALAVTSDGDVVLSGSWDVGEDYLTVMRVSGVTGQPIWTREIDGARYAFGGSSLAVGGDGDIVVSGLHGLALFAAKLRADNGAILWFEEITGSGAGSSGSPPSISPKSIAVAEDGSVAVAGVEYNGGVGPTFGDFVVAKLDGSSGNQLWKQQLHTEGVVKSDTGFDVGFDEQGNVIATGHIQPSGNRNRVVVVKITDAGSLVWRKDFPNLIYTTSLLSPSGESYVCGSRISPSGRVRGFLAKVKPEGRRVWRRGFLDADCIDVLALADDHVIAVIRPDSVSPLLRFVRLSDLRGRVIARF